MSPVRTPSGLIAIATRHPASAEDVCSVSNALVLVAIDVQDPATSAHSFARRKLAA
jgi:hypothetical protein